jgi:hypothetical protein
MRRSLRRIGTIAVVFICAAILPEATRSVGSPASARAADPPPSADSGTGELFTLIYTVATRPEGEVAHVAGDTFHLKYTFAVVKQFRVRPDGSFAFEGGDFGFYHGEDVWTHAGKETRGVANCQPLLRATGKWQPAAGAEGESLTLRLEWAPGAGTLVSKLPDNQTLTVTDTISPDGKFQTSTWQEQGKAKSSSSTKRIEYNVSEWALKPAAPRNRSGQLRPKRAVPTFFTQIRLPRAVPPPTPIADPAQPPPQAPNQTTSKYEDQRTTKLNECFKNTEAKETIRVIRPALRALVENVQQKDLDAMREAIDRVTKAFDAL